MANACPACGKKYSLPAGAVGRAFVCKRCGLKLQITEHGLVIPSVPDNGPPIQPPQPIDQGPAPSLELLPVDGGRPVPAVPVAADPRGPAPARPVAAAPPVAMPSPAAYLPPEYFPVPPPPTPPRPARPRPRADEYDVTPVDEPAEPPRPRRRKAVSGNAVLDYLFLRRHIAPVLAVGVFWVGTLFLVVSGLSMVVWSFNAPTGLSVGTGGLDLGGAGLDEAGGLPPGGFKMPEIKEKRGFSPWWFVFGLLQAFVGPVVLRVLCEFVIVVFRINEMLLDLKDRLGRGPP